MYQAHEVINLDPNLGDLEVFATGRKTAEGTRPFFDPVTGDADPGGPDEFEVTAVYWFDKRTSKWKRLTPELFEALFGDDFCRNLIEFLEANME